MSNLEIKYVMQVKPRYSFSESKWKDHHWIDEGEDWVERLMRYRNGYKDSEWRIICRQTVSTETVEEDL